jgi:hypothetical protein
MQEAMEKPTPLYVQQTITPSLPITISEEQSQEIARQIPKTIPPALTVPPRVKPKRSYPELIRTIINFIDDNSLVMTQGTIALSIIFAITGTIVFLSWNTSDPNTSTVRSSPYVRGGAVESISASRDRLVLQNAIQQYQNNDGVTEIRIQKNSGAPVPFREFNTLVNISLYPAFANSVRDYRIGWYRQEPWVLLQVPDSHVSRGGMLEWEEKITRDFSSIFGVTLTLNTNLSFTDKTVNGNDVRILLDSNGIPIIQYGFTPTGILITTSELSFINLLANLKNE